MARNGAAKKAKRDVHVYEDVTDVPIALSADELAKFSRDFAAKSIEVDRHQDEKREFLSEWREDTKELKAEHDRLRSIVNEKAAPKRMRCKIELDFDESEVRFYDLKTGKQIGQRPMSKEDRQLAIPGSAPPEKTGGPAGSDKPPKGEKPGRLTGRSKQPDVEPPRHPDREPTADNEIPF